MDAVGLKNQYHRTLTNNWILRRLFTPHEMQRAACYWISGSKIYCVL